MASQAGVVEVPVKPDSKHFGRALANQVGREVSGAGGAINRAFSSLGKGVALAGAAVGAAAAAALADQFVKALDVDRGRAKLAGQLGLTAEESERYGKLAGDLYSSAYGDSMEQVNASLAAVQHNMGDLSSFTDAELTDITKRALTVAGAFDIDVSEATRAAGQMMRNGLAPDAKTAFDVITAGLQGSAGGSGDLLDTLNEYSPAFTALGFSGEQAMAVISAAAEAGIRDTDLAGDALKEFFNRATDGTAATSTAYQTLGLDAEAMATAIAGGGPAATTAFSTILTELANITDPVKQRTAGVALFGSTWEDTGPQIIAAMDPAKASLDGVTGASDQLIDTVTESTAVKWDSFVRGVQGATQQWIVNAVLPNLNRLIQTVGPDLLAAITGTSTDGSMSAEEFDRRTTTAFQSLADFISDVLIPAIEKIRGAGEHLDAFEDASDRTSKKIYDWWTSRTLDLWRKVIEVTSAGALGFINTADSALGWIPGWGERLDGAARAVETFRDDGLTALDAFEAREVSVEVSTEAARGALTSFYGDWNNRNLSWALASEGAGAGRRGYGDGPGRPPPGGGGGSAQAKMRSAIAAIGGGVSITSSYRTPARNAAVGGSPRSYHMDKGNPAVDVVGAAGTLDRLYAALRRTSYRELIWRAPGHYDHLHYAHQGGVVSKAWGTLPGLRADERPVITQVGEAIIPRASVRDLGAVMREGMAEGSRQQSNTFNIVGVSDPAEAAHRSAWLLRMS